MTSRAQKRAIYRKLRPKVRKAAWTRDGHVCRVCSRYVQLHGGHGRLGWGAEMHELLPRSLGGSPTDPRNVLTLCTDCHYDVGMRVGGRRLTITALTTRGANGPVQIARTFGRGEATMSISEPTQQLEEHDGQQDIEDAR